MTNQNTLGPGLSMSTSQRWSIYALIIMAASFAIIGRILVVQSRATGDDALPTLSANDRSRWLTVWSLGEHQTYEWDSVFNRMPEHQKRHWNSIDRVVHSDSNGDQKVYSSKPTLLPTILAGEYILLKRMTGKTIESHPFFVIRTLLAINNGLCLIFFLISMGAIADRVAYDDWSRMFILVSAAFGTYLSTFAVTLTNHLPATMSVAIGLHQVIAIRQGQNGILRFALCGLFAAFAAANELPATAVIALFGFYCCINSIIRTIIGFIPGLAIVVAGFFYTNYQAHDTWRPAYSFRSDGEVVSSIQDDSEEQVQSLYQKQLSKELIAELESHQESLNIESLDQLTVFEGRWPKAKGVSQRWVVVDEKSVCRAAITQPEDTKELNIHRWGNWYEYGYGGGESPWLIGNTSGFDIGEANQVRYTLHLLIGHHGVLVIMPVFLLTWVGLPWGLLSRAHGIRFLTVLISAITIVVIGFYVSRPIDVRNYGGLCSAPRWLFWLMPLWLLITIPLLDFLSRSSFVKWLAAILLGISVASANYSPLNPWVEPWPYHFRCIEDDSYERLEQPIEDLIKNFNSEAEE